MYNGVPFVRWERIRREGRLRGFVEEVDAVVQKNHHRNILQTPLHVCSRLMISIVCLGGMKLQANS